MRWMHKRVGGRVWAGCLVVWLAAGLAVPEAAAQPRGLATYESRAYRIHTNLSRAEAREYGVHMDLIFKEYSKRFSVLRGRQRGKENLYLLRTREDYIEAMAAFDFDARGSGGVFFVRGNLTGIATWVEGLPREVVRSTLQHEGFHQFAHAKLGDRLPLWVNEGLAEYFGAAIVVDGQVRTGIVDADRMAKINRAIERGQALGFAEVLQIQSPQWLANLRSGTPRGGLQYDQSWATTHFLIHADRGRYRNAFGDYLVLISEGRTHRQAFERTFGTNDLRAFERRWLEFMAEVEPDRYSVALKRMEFLGTGLRFLHENNIEPPGDAAALREALQSRGFGLRWTTESGPKEVRSDDETLYVYLDRKDQEHGFEVVAAANGSGLPPSISAPWLRPAVTLRWVKDQEGNLRSQLEYSKSRRR